MIITRNPDALDLPLPLDLSQGTSVTVGNFDGVHLGHQALLAMTCERAAATGTLPVAMTFNPHPLEVLTPYAPPRLTTPQGTAWHCWEASGMALVMLVVFTPEFAAMSPETFVRRILLGTLNMRELLLGYDFTLGKGRAGTPEVLAQLGKAEGFNVDRMDALSVHDEVVSSTRIRELLHQGQVWEASSLLGRLYSVQGEVIHGKNRGGRLLGIPHGEPRPHADHAPQARRVCDACHAVGIRRERAPLCLRSGALHLKHISGGDEHRVQPDLRAGRAHGRDAPA